MHLVDLTLPLPEENVALDEALLDAREAGEITGPVLRVWEPEDYFVVLGRSSDAAVEVNLAACRAEHIPILRRASGGGTVLAGPGCLMYSIVLSYADHADARDISAAHRLVLTRNADALLSLVPGINLAGTSDLALHQGDLLQKFSGNSLRCKRDHFLYHGTLLYDFDLDRVTRYLAQQTREPVYRAGRTHRAFLANVPATREQLVNALVHAWQATETLITWPQERMRVLTAKPSSEI